MCTVTFIPRRHGYALGMNRDEQRSRVEALPPSKHRVGARSASYPSEPGGGTWIGVNDARVTFALINWYSVQATVDKRAVTRGAVVPSVLEAVSPDSANLLLGTLPLSRTKPFRIIGVFPDVHEVVEWRWNLEHLARIDRRWRSNAWFSSGFDEPRVKITRGKTFKKALLQKSAGSLEWLRRLHRSHQPERGACSICMHRADASTVSYTEVVTSQHGSLIRYSSGCPCSCKMILRHASASLASRAQLGTEEARKQRTGRVNIPR